MIIVSPREFRANLRHYFTIAEKESVFISRPDGKLFLVSHVSDKDVPIFKKCCSLDADKQLSEIFENLEPVKSEKVAYYIDPLVSKGIEFVSSEEGISPEEWLSSVAEIRILNGSGCCSMSEFINSYLQEEEEEEEEEEISQYISGNNDTLLKDTYITSELKSCIRSFLRANVSILKISSRAINSLHLAKINEVGNLCCFSVQELKKIRGLGNESIKEICSALKEKGIELGDGLAQKFGYPVHK